VADLVAAFAGRYTLERELGRGGMATVYLARDLKHGRPVALKVLRPDLTAILGGDRFLQEIRVTAALQHPHILPLLDSGEAAGFLFYVMPHVGGESLRARLGRDGPLPLVETVQIARGIAGALDYAHRQGVIHRDVKPENILLYQGEPMVADFGISLAISTAGMERLTETGLSLGTPAYMSPEQAAADPKLDGRADQYSLACVVYEMLSGEPPYTGPNARTILLKALSDPAPSVRRLRADVPPALDSAIVRALGKTPPERFPTMGDFIARLIDTSQVATQVVSRTRLPRRRLLWLAGAATILAAAAATTLLPARTATTDERRVLVLPFREPDRCRFAGSLGASRRRMGEPEPHPHRQLRGIQPDWRRPLPRPERARLRPACRGRRADHRERHAGRGLAAVRSPDHRRCARHTAADGGRRRGLERTGPSARVDGGPCRYSRAPGRQPGSRRDAPGCRPPACLRSVSGIQRGPPSLGPPAVPARP
jgi:hypothetical protein